MEIEIGKKYNYFDDGKIWESRRLTVEITEIIPFKDIDDTTLCIWKSEVEQCYWLYSKETDYFVKGLLETEYIEIKYEEIIFVRTLDGGWFSLGWWGGRLDVDGKLAILSNKNSQK